MTTLRSLAPLTIALALAACSQSQGRQVMANPGPAAGYPARLALTAGAVSSGWAPAQPDGGQWQAAADRLVFGVPGQAPLLSLACEPGPAGTTRLRIERTTRAEAGAKALVALIGNGRIARLPLNALSDGEAGRWEGVVRARDARLDVLKGGNSIEATLPGGGTLKLPASLEPRRLLEACRARDTAPDEDDAALVSA